MLRRYPDTRQWHQQRSSLRQPPPLSCSREIQRTARRDIAVEKRIGSARTKELLCSAYVAVSPYPPRMLTSQQVYVPHPVRPQDGGSAPHAYPEVRLRAVTQIIDAMKKLHDV